MAKKIKYRTVRALNPSFDPRDATPERQCSCQHDERVSNPRPRPERNADRERRSAQRLARGEHR